MNYRKERIVIGLVGPMAGGKGVLAQHFAVNGFHYQSLSDRVREEADRRGLVRTRVVLQDVGNDLRFRYGPCILAERTVAMIPDDVTMIVIEGIRNHGELIYLREVLDAVIIGVNAPAELRLQWYLKRAVERGEDGVTEDDFWKADARDRGEGETIFGQQGAQCMRMVDYRIQNDGSDRIFREGERIIQERFGILLEGRTKGKEN